VGIGYGWALGMGGHWVWAPNVGLCLGAYNFMFYFTP